MSDIKIDPKDVEDSLGIQNLPEAPRSISLTGYYKGFSVLVTQRDPKTSTYPLLQNAMKAIDWMIDNNFKPSWNTQTNRELMNDTPRVASNAPVPSGDAAWISEKSDAEEKFVRAPIPSSEGWCNIHKVDMQQRNGKYGMFYSHVAGQQPDGRPSYCSGKIK